MKKIFLLIFLAPICLGSKAQDSTYAQRLGFPKDARVIILHMDDAGMSLSSDRGIEKVFEKGVANSTSVMMPCPWVPQMVRYIKTHPDIDAGLHLTLTSEWKDYRWVPLAGAAVVPGLVDSTGSLWRGVADVVKHASSDRGIEKVFEKGAANSTSVMMPCPWVPQMVRYINAHPDIDAGLHLTLTSEWKDYRWVPLAGAAVVPGLVDSTGSLWRGVADVVKHASSEEVDKEIRAQLQRAEKMNFHPTHLDSHMGTLFATDAFLQKYIQLGIEKQIPVMFPGGHDTYISDEMKIPDNVLHYYQNLGKKIWDGGLPVLDDLLNSSYDWNPPADIVKNEKALAKWRVDLYEKEMLKLKPGVTMVIMHCTDPSSVFSEISDSGDKRRADMLAMLDAGFKKFIKDNGFILTTWRELMDRRQKIK